MTVTAMAVGINCALACDSLAIRAKGVTVNGKRVSDCERRVFPDGEAVRYRLPAGPRHVTDEATQWCLPPDARVWMQIEGADGIDYESLFTNTTVEALQVGQRMSFPVTAKLADGSYRLITEANVVDYTDSCAVYCGNGLFGIEYYADTNGFDQVGAETTPWRVMLQAKDLQTLATSDIVRRLCPAPSTVVAEKCASFVRPGRAVWQWLSAGNPVYAEQKDWYDRTKALGFEYYLIDAGWKRWRDGTMDEWKCLKKWIDYGKSIGVESFIWAHSKEMCTPEARREYLSRVKASGAVGIKIDFVPIPSYAQMKWYEETSADTFAIGLMLDYHGAVKPTGREKTWPHEVAREAIRGHEYHMTRYKRVMPPEQDCILPFTRLVQGHADYTPMVFEPGELNGYTWARELAQGIVFSAPFLCLGDYPRNYLANPATEMIRALPAVYDETRILPGSEIGECIAVAKRKGKDWFVAVENGAAERRISINFNFLGNLCGELRGYADAEDRPNGYVVDSRTITCKDEIVLTLRPRGGYAAWIRAFAADSSGFTIRNAGARSVWSVREHGAVGDGVAKDTAAIQAAIDAAAEAGGGRVVLSAGTYLSGTLYLKSGVDLHLEKEAVLKASPERGDYCAADAFDLNYASALDNMSGGHLLVCARQRNVTLSGSGTIDGSAREFFRMPDGSWPVSKKAVPWRPGQMLYFIQDENVTVCGLKLRNSPYWSFLLHGCENVQIAGLDVETPRETPVYNGDGIDVDSCRHVRISGCRIRTLDDSITLRCNTGCLDAPRDCTDIRISDCELSSFCNALRIGVGTNRVEDVVIERIRVRETRTGLNITGSYSAKATSGCHVRNVIFRDWDVETEWTAAIFYPGPFEPDKDIDFTVSDVTFERFKAVEGKPSVFRGVASRPFRGIRMVNADFRLKDGRPTDFMIENAEVTRCAR